MNRRDGRVPPAFRITVCFPVLAMLLVGCAHLETGGKVALTPLTVVRDVVDTPLVSVTNVFEFFADQTHPAKAPGVGVGWSWRGGFNFGIGYDISYFVFKAVSGVFGGADYLVCRSVWPNFAWGVSPWRGKDGSWGSLYFPNTRALWAGEGPLADEKPPAWE